MTILQRQTKQCLDDPKSVKIYNTNKAVNSDVEI